MKRVRILVEGQTEETFVGTLLAPHLWSFGVSAEPTIAATKRVKSGGKFKGGVTNFDKVRNDVLLLLGDSSTSLVTTMIDFYRLPSDFPGTESCPQGSAATRATFLESEFQKVVGSPRFEPYFTLHEFEALVFAALPDCASVFPEPSIAKKLAEVCSSFPTPEDINDGDETAPSKRIAKVFPGYQKPLHGPQALTKAGLAKLRTECPRFGRWVSRLEAIGSPT